MSITRSSEDPKQPRACAYKRGMAWPNSMQQYGGRLKNGEKTRASPDCYTGSAKKHVYGQLRGAIL